MKELIISSTRYAEEEHWQTGIYIRAKHLNGEWDSVDIATLEKESLLEFLKSRGGDNKWAEDCVGIILGHGHLHTQTPSKGQEE